MYLNEIIEHKRNEIRNLVPAELKRQRPVADPLPHLRDKPFITEIKKPPRRGEP